jgi:hypothetical protein
MTSAIKSKMYPVQQPYSYEAPMGWLHRYENEHQTDWRGGGGKVAVRGGEEKNGGGWSNDALNRGLGVRTSGYLRRGMGDNLPTSVFTFDRRNILLNEWRSGIIFFRLFL